MNFSKLFGGSKANQNASASNDGVRQQHYAFAHRWLRTVARTHPNPLNLMRALRDADETSLLRELWTEAGGDLPAVERASSQGLSADVMRVEQSPEIAYLLAVVTMPEARGVTEAHFVAISFGPLLNDEPTPNTQLRYFTLELGLSLMNEARTAFCEWDKDGTHLNFGNGPQPDSQAFANAVLQKLAGDDSSPIASFKPGTES